MSAFPVRVSIFMLFVAALFGSFQTLHAVCPPGWLAWQHSCYILLPEKMNWLQASRLCDRPGSSLFMPGSQEEQDFIWREMRMWMMEFSAKSDLELWIDCQDLYDNASRLVCSGNEVYVDFTNWAEKEPNKISSTCIRMTDEFGGEWGDTSCNRAKFVACEMRASRRVYCLPSDAEGRFTPQCLLNHHIKNLTTTGVTGCGQACWAEPRCHSFNLWQQAGRVKICQLNNASRSDADINDLKLVDNCSFFDL